MPAWSALAPFRFPSWLSRFSCLPKHKIFHISLFLLLILLLLLSLSLSHSLQLAILKLLAVGFDVKVDRLVGLVCIAIVDDLLNEFDDFVHVLSDAGEVVGQLHSQLPHIFKELCFPLFGKLEILDTLFP